MPHQTGPSRRSAPGAGGNTLSVADRRFSYLLICSSYPPVLGGSEIEAQRVSAALLARGHRVKIVTMGGGPMPPLKNWTDPFGVPVRIWGSGLKHPWSGYAFAFGAAWTLFRERRNYEIAYFLMQGLQLATGLPTAHILGKPVIMKFSGSNLIEAMKGSLLGRLELRLLGWWARRILILNPGMVEEAKGAGLDPKLLTWMANPVDTDQFRPPSGDERKRLRQELKVAENAPLAIFVGRLGPEKRTPSLIGAMRRVALERPDARLVLVGDGPLRGALEELVRTAGLEQNVILTGRLPVEGVLKWLQAGDIFTLVSELEGLPCSLIEAMAVGLAPVVSEIPAHTQLIEAGKNGLLIEVGSEEAIARALLDLIEDPGLRGRIGTAARQTALERFSTPIVIDSYEQLFAECTGKGSPA